MPTRSAVALAHLAVTVTVTVTVTVMVTVMALASCGDNLVAICPNQAGAALESLEQHGFVAHAGGSPDGLQQGAPYTNSRQAFETSYRNGFRVYEFDLITLGDGTVVLAHDFHEEHYGLDRSFREITRADLEGRRYDGKYELLFAEDLIELMLSHPDIWIILDTKWDHEFIARRLIELSPGPAVSDRFVPHLASSEHTEALRAIYPFPEQMIAMYRWAGDDTTLLARMERYDIDNVMMWWDIRWSPETQALLDGSGHHVWVHTPQEPDLIESFRAQGVRVYTDGYISPCGQYPSRFRLRPDSDLPIPVRLRPPVLNAKRPAARGRGAPGIGRCHQRGGDTGTIRGTSST